jgi:toxin-antitoxin system PIN domain toxin
MTSSIFLDVNVWLALNHEVHAHHATATKWFESLDDEVILVFCRQTQMSFFRLMTTEAVLGREVITQRQCWEIYDRWIYGGKAVLAVEPAGLEAALRQRTSGESSSPKIWADAYLAAFATAAGITLVTYDRALAGKVEGAVLLG